MSEVVSKYRTRIAHDRRGSGPPIVEWAESYADVPGDVELDILRVQG